MASTFTATEAADDMRDEATAFEAEAKTASSVANSIRVAGTVLTGSSNNGFD